MPDYFGAPLHSRSLSTVSPASTALTVPETAMVPAETPASKVIVREVIGKQRLGESMWDRPES